jgi:hypothetical protein
MFEDSFGRFVDLPQAYQLRYPIGRTREPVRFFLPYVTTIQPCNIPGKALDIMPIVSKARHFPEMGFWRFSLVSSNESYIKRTA